MDVLLDLTLSLAGGISGGEATTDGTGALGAEVQRLGLGALVEQTKLIPLGLGDDGEDASNGLAQLLATDDHGT